MKQPVLGVRRSVGAIVAGELTAALCAAALLAAAVDARVAAGVAIALGIMLCVVTFGGLPVWRWLLLVGRWLRQRRHKVQLAEPTDVEIDGTPMGVLVDKHTVVTMVSVWGKPYMPTLLRPEAAETPNTLPITVIAGQMHRVGLGVDVDVIAEGSRTSGDTYADLYAQFLRGRAATGRRTATLVVRLDTRAADTTMGLLVRRNSIEAAYAATRRIVRALQQVNCRAEILTAAQMREASIAGLGGADAAAETYEDQWGRLHRRGRGYVTSYYLSAEDITAAALDDVWSYPTQHTTLVVALRRGTEGVVRVSALVRLITAQPLPAPPALVLNRFTGRQWDAIADTLMGAERVAGLPSTPVTAELDAAVVVGPSGVLLGKFRDSFLLMPLSDPARPTRIALTADSDLAVRQLIRRAAAAGERVAVYDNTGAWTMTAGSSRIWTTSDMSAQPPRPPTMVVHNGCANPYPGAWISVMVGRASGGDPDIMIDQRGREIRLATNRFRTVVEAVTFRNEQAYLN